MKIDFSFSCATFCLILDGNNKSWKQAFSNLYPVKCGQIIGRYHALEQIMKEIRRRTRVIGAFPDGYSAMMMVGAKLRHFDNKMGNSPVFEH